MKNIINATKDGIAGLVKTAIGNINNLREQLTFVRPLSADERAQVGRVERRGPRIIQERLEALQRHPGVVPADFDLSGFTRDAADLQALQECLEAIERLRTDVRDTFLGIYVRATRTSHEAYGYLRVAAEQRDHLQRTVSDIAPRRRTRSASAAVTPTASPPRPGEPAPATGSREATTTEVKAA